jgi:protein O-GlcNAc transferase
MSFVAMWFGFGQNEHFDRGLSAWERKEYGEAAVHFQKAVGSETNDRVREKAISYLAGALAQLGMISLNADEFADAADRFREALRLRPNFPDVQYNLAWSLIQLGKFDEAKTCLESALERNPNYALAQLRLAALQIREGRVEEGWREAEKAAQADYLQGEAWERARQAAKAEDWPKVVTELLTLVPTRRVNLLEKVLEGDKAMHANDFGRAQEHYAAAVSLAPTFPDLRRRLGEAQFMANEHEKAISTFRQALELNPNYADAGALLGVVYRRLGREAEAMECFHKATEVEPNHIIAALEIEMAHSYASDDDDDEEKKEG